MKVLGVVAVLVCFLALDSQSYAKPKQSDKVVPCPATVKPKESKPTKAVSIPPNHTCTPGSHNSFPTPDASCTPGAVNPTVTLAILQSNDFKTGCIRNQTTTEDDKKVTYDWYNITKPSNNTGQTQVCELDHLIPLELGGADTLDNIWPQCGPDQATLNKRYFKQKTRSRITLLHR